MEIFVTLDTFDTDFSADSIEWCPMKPFTDLFVCGTYQLSSEEIDSVAEASGSRKRLGRIYLFQAIDSGKLKLLQQLEAAAVLDMKWAHVKLHDKILLGIVNSIGHLHIYELIDIDNPTLTSFKKIEINCNREEVLALSLDWSTGRWTNDTNQNVRIVVSDSKGSISVFKLYDEELEKESSWMAHEFEAWIAAFDYWNSNIVYSGGDDCKFQRFDLRIGSQPVAVSRVHGAGVTSLHSNSASEFSLASGSYDEILRLWDTRYFRQSLSETNLGGGIWRLKWDPFVRRYLLAACMYDGFRIVDCKSKESPMVIGRYMEHGSISYGCDWSFLTSQEILQRKLFEKQAGDNIILTGTCSFYDHTLKLSAVRLNDD